MIANRGGPGGKRPGAGRPLGAKNKPGSKFDRGTANVQTKSAGRIGRPTGRKDSSPRDVTLVTQAAQAWIPAAMDRLALLAGIMPDPNNKGKCLPGAVSEPAQISAISILWDRAYGKVTQPMKHSVDEGLEQLLDRLGGV